MRLLYAGSTSTGIVVIRVVFNVETGGFQENVEVPTTLFSAIGTGTTRGARSSFRGVEALLCSFCLDLSVVLSDRGLDLLLAPLDVAVLEAERERLRLLDCDLLGCDFASWIL